MTAADLAGPNGASQGAGALRLPNPDGFRPGISVVHPEFGLGQLVTVEGEGAGRKGRVAFAVGPARTFVLAKSPLRPVAAPTSNGRSPRRPGDAGRS
jgi:DNA helicase II / ATP-dependent DNA helicase PcrA